MDYKNEIKKMLDKTENENIIIYIYEILKRLNGKEN